MNSVIRQFWGKGWAYVGKAVSHAELAILQQACDRLLAEPPDDGGGSRHRIGLGQDRRFLAHHHESFPNLEAMLLTGAIGRMAQAILGSECFLFNEHFVVKGPRTGAGFAWHQDSAYVGFDHAPYLSIWIALDHSTIENGCLRVLDRNLDSSPVIDPHSWNEATRELVGYSGTDQGTPVTCRAGSAVVFSSLTLHSSGENVTKHSRRAYLAQYSREPLRDPETGKLKRFAKPVRAEAE